MKKHTIDIQQLEKDLQAKGYSGEEIQKVLAGAKDINAGNFFTLEDVYKSLFAKKHAHVHA